MLVSGRFWEVSDRYPKKSQTRDVRIGFSSSEALRIPPPYH
jgi:hypothetical protein